MSDMALMLTSEQLAAAGSLPVETVRAQQHLVVKTDQAVVVVGGAVRLFIRGESARLNGLGEATGPCLVVTDDCGAWELVAAPQVECRWAIVARSQAMRWLPAGQLDSHAARVATAAVQAGTEREAELVGVTTIRRSSDGLVAGRAAVLVGSLFRSGDETLAVDPSLPPILRACRHVALVSGVPLMRIPRRIPECADFSPDAMFATEVGIGTRLCQLGPGWWRADGGALLAWRKSDGAPVALQYRRGYQAYIFVPGGTLGPLKVDEALAQELEPTARIFRAPLPEGRFGLVWFLKFVLAPSRDDLLAAGLVSIIGSVLNLAAPMGAAILISEVLPTGSGSGLIYLGVGLAAAAACSEACHYVSSIFLVRIYARGGTMTSAAVLDRMLRLPLAFFRRFSAGDLADRLGGVERVQRVLTLAGLKLVVKLTFALVFLLMMATVSLGATVAALTLMVVMFGVAARTAVVQGRLSADAMERAGHLDGFLLQVLRAMEKVRSAAAEDNVLLVWLQRYRRQRKSLFEADLRGLMLHTLSTSVPLLGAVGLWLLFTHQGTQDVPVLTATYAAFSAAFVAALGAVINAGAALGEVTQALPALERIRPIVEEPLERPRFAEHPPRLRGALTLEGVRFTYPGSPVDALRGISIDIKPGSFVALVGPSGSGKSTLLQIACGLQRPSGGRVLLDGRDLARLDPVGVRRQMGVVVQRPTPFPASMFENIVGSSLLTVDDAWEAARLAGIAELIESLPMGMHTIIQEGSLSGGQMQKLMIARALVGRPGYLLLDEATSALDEISQAHVSLELERLGATRLVVAHRLSTIRHADQIHVLVDGRIVESGTYDQLISTGGHLAQMAKRQTAES